MVGILTLFHSLRQNIGSAIKVMQAKNLKTIIEDEVDEDEYAFEVYYGRRSNFEYMLFFWSFFGVFSKVYQIMRIKSPIF